MKGPNQSLVIFLHGGLGDQLRKYFGGVNLGQELGRRVIFNTTLQAEWHSGDSSSLEKLLGFIPIDNSFGITRLRWRARIERRLGNYTNILILNRIFGYIRDFNRDSYFNILTSPQLFNNLRSISVPKTLFLDCYFPTFENFYKVKRLSNIELRVTKPSIEIGNGCLIHFRMGDAFSNESTPQLCKQYYEEAVAIFKRHFPDSKLFGISDDIGKAKSNYNFLDINWINDSDSWDSHQLISLMIQSKSFISSHSGISLWASALAPRKHFCVIPSFDDESLEITRIIKTLSLDEAYLLPAYFE